MDIEAAHILFPNDKPTVVGGDVPAPASTPAPAADQRAGEVGSLNGTPERPTLPAKNEPDPAAQLFKDDVPDAFATTAKILSGFAEASVADNDGGERMRAIEAASAGLIADAKQHGTSAEELGEAMQIVKERQADGLCDLTPEIAEQRMSAARVECTQDAYHRRRSADRVPLGRRDRARLAGDEGDPE